MLPPSPTTRPRIYILGGGFSGLYTALHLSRLSWGNQSKPHITLIDQNDRFLFTPFLYELVTGELQAWEIAPAFAKLLKGTDVKFQQGTVERVDLEERQIRLESGETFTYDRLVLAVGAEASLNAVPGAEPYAYPFRTLSDAKHLKEQLRFLEASDRSKIRIVVAGGGPSGVELAGKLADRLGERGQIRLVERGETLLKTFTRFTRRVAHRGLEARGVQVDLKTGIAAVEPEEVVLVRDQQVETIPTDLVLWTVGMQISSWVHSPNLQRNHRGQLIAEATLQLVGHPDVFAMGDLAAIQDGNGKPVPATAQAAYQQAACAARNLKASLGGGRLHPFRYLHLGEMITLGTRTATVSSFGLNFQGILATVIRRLVYLLLRMPTLTHRFQVARHWLSRLVSGWRPRRKPAPVVLHPRHPHVANSPQQSREVAHSTTTIASDRSGKQRKI